ncbi:alginate O-acetyltransferase AlgF [Pacificibacter maritimus]|uniref:Alginate biosynthesis protein AlgF n=1 Tax=Pacificibacter maritimus TaxID=762213 RepID=A0A3N4UWD2_9RHOB|nr:alginate O-acetyltransferase AlgF [Pacificibacter maritimus]RPE71861.1 alginate O-acetyltransferase AlgF [Pacificibacter maritimus]
METIKNICKESCGLLRVTAVAMSIFLACSGQAFAQDEELYGAPLPDDAAFVRALGAHESVAVDAFGVTLTNEGDYTVILAGSTDGIETDQYITILPAATVLHPAHEDAAKVQVGFFNVGYEADLALKTADGKVTIAEAALNSAGFREVNPIVVPVAVFDGDKMLGESIELKLRRGENPTIFAQQDGTVTTIVSKIIWDE